MPQISESRKDGYIFVVGDVNIQRSRRRDKVRCSEYPEEFPIGAGNGTMTAEKNVSMF